MCLNHWCSDLGQLMVLFRDATEPTEDKACLETVGLQEAGLEGGIHSRLSFLLLHQAESCPP